MSFEVGEAPAEVGDFLPFGIGEHAVLEIGFDAAPADHAAGDADDRAMGGHGGDDDGTGADPYVIADADAAEDFCAGADDDVVADGRMALAALFAGAAQRYALIDENIVADLGRFADTTPMP